MGKPKQHFDSSGNSPKQQQKIAKLSFTQHNLTSVHPKTQKQKELFEAYLSNIPIILQDGLAGTGKTFTSMYLALRDVLDKNVPNAQKLVIFRSAVEGRRIGFLKGDEEEKMEPFERPYKQIADQLIEDYSCNNYNNMKVKGLIDFQLTTHQRGMTYDNAIILIDEIQNMDAEEILTICTRAGVNTRIIMMGDFKQDDLQRYREKSGFEYIKKVLNLMPHDYSTTITYTSDDIVRSDLVKQFLIADSKVTE